MSEKRLVSLDEHNATRRRERAEFEKRQWQTGVACPACGTEMLWDEQQTTTLQMPPPTTRRATCHGCGVAAQVET